jgi:hypothetical protein
MDEAEALDLLAEYVEWRDAGDEIKTAEAKVAVIAAMRKAGGVPQWQTIDSAPKDARFLAYQDGEIYSCKWREAEPDGDGGCWQEGWHDLVNDTIEAPTHWLPMPAFAAAPQPPALDRDGIIEGLALTLGNILAEFQISVPPERQEELRQRLASAAIRAMKGDKT